MNTGKAENAAMAENTKLAAYCLWECTGHRDTMALWYCTEDMASLLERSRICSLDSLMGVLRLNRSEREYQTFVRHLSYRIHKYTGIQDEKANWYTVEKLLDNPRWREAMTVVADGLRSMREGQCAAVPYKILSPAVREFYA